jgi:Bacterial Ig domain/Bacterial lectin
VRYRWKLGALAPLVVAPLLVVAPAHLPGVSAAKPGRLATTQIVPIGADADQSRTSWYPNAGVAPSEVNGADFGELFSQQLKGGIYAQPLVDNSPADGPDGILLAVTEGNYAYGLNAKTGAIEWSRHFGTPWNPGTCGDLVPTIGITGTPVIDPSKNTAYFTTDITAPGKKDTASWWLQAVNVATGAEAAGFPVRIQGRADNQNRSAAPFDAQTEMQRPGLALVNGVVYMGFGSHCDEKPWQGWIFGVNERGRFTARWVDETNGATGAGIWGSGGGLVVDGSGNLYFATGNGNSPQPGRGRGARQPQGPGKGLGECVVKLSTTNNALHLADYFCPSDALQLNNYDGDLGSGSPTALPMSFGTSQYPDLMVEAGKQGEVYLLNMNSLGGMTEPGQPDNVVDEAGPKGGVWTHPAVWPGDGGYIYIPTASPGGTALGSSGELDVYQRVTDGTSVALNWVGDVPSFGFSSSSPSVTSVGMDPGSAIVWVVRIPPGATEGEGATLNAYAADPVTGDSGQPDTLRELWSAPVGDGSKFVPPLPADGKIYVGNRNGDLLAYGVLPGAPALHGSAINAPSIAVGSSVPTTATFTATRTTTINEVSLDNETVGASTAFTAGTTTPRLPVTLSAGDTLTVPIRFSPEVIGGQTATLTVSTSSGTVSVPVTGTGLAPSVPIGTRPSSVNFGTLAIGGTPASQTVAVTNNTPSKITIDSYAFQGTGANVFSLRKVNPRPPFTLGPGDTESVNVVFTPPTTSGDFVQTFTADLEINIKGSAGPPVAVPLQGDAAPSAQIAISSLHVNFGTVALGQSRTETFTVADTGGVPLTINKSKPPVVDGFSALTALPEGSVIAAHTAVAETVQFRPTRIGSESSTWIINGTGSGGVQTVVFTGKGARWPMVPPPSKRGWKLNGTATRAGPDLVLTPAENNAAGSAFWTHPVLSDNLHVSFDAQINNGGAVGGDGLTLALANAAKATPASLGGDGSDLGWGGITGVAIALATYPSPTNPHANSIGVVTYLDRRGDLVWANEYVLAADLRSGKQLVEVSITHDLISVSLDGIVLFNESVAVPKRVYVGFTAGTGAKNDKHVVSNVQIADPGPAPSARAHTYQVRAGERLVVGAPGVLAGAVKSPGQSLTAVLLSRPGHGSLTLHRNGSFRFSPTRGSVGTTSFRFEACDPPELLCSAPTTVTLQVRAPG